MADKQVKIKITSAVAIGGEIKRPGTIVTVAEELAKNLLHRGRAELATGESKPLSKMSAEELKGLAASLDIDGADGMKKADLIEYIELAQSE
ncbi:Rho termination factor N-terminal domain-containing protein [Ascidiaceihabitans sp.]|uniref:Rho termination factor N-terminal domain-containing protein n=1 Tax=Ascidiaceihabitans sp. TaxID=1872644 RepID=UPI003298CE55